MPATRRAKNARNNAPMGRPRISPEVPVVLRFAAQLRCRSRPQPFRHHHQARAGLARGPSPGLFPVFLFTCPNGPRRVTALRICVVRGQVHKYTNPPHSAGWLCPSRKRPRSRRAAEQRDELAAFHSITSSARASSVGGTSRPSAFAALRLIANSNLVGCTTGRSAGRAPFSTRPT
jgi:hypothetical protein